MLKIGLQPCLSYNQNSGIFWMFLLWLPARVKRKVRLMFAISWEQDLRLGPDGAHHLHEALSTLWGDDSEVWLAAVDHLGAWRWGRRLGQNNFPQTVAVWNREQPWRGPGTGVAVSCKRKEEPREIHENKIQQVSVQPDSSKKKKKIMVKKCFSFLL